METQFKKCSSNKHSEIDAISYCQLCKRTFCNKCQNLHSELFEDHKIINLNNDLNGIFIDFLLKTDTLYLLNCYLCTGKRNKSKVSYSKKIVEVLTKKT